MFKNKKNAEKPVTKLYLGCAQPPFHAQHLEILGDPNEWTWVDLHVKHKNIKNWDASELLEVKNNSIEHIYASHLLEHFPQIEIRKILGVWNKKLKKGGRLTLNVPDLVWACEALQRRESGKKLTGYFTEFDGNHGLMSIFYGSQVHPGEFHKAGFTKSFLKSLLNEAGFGKIQIQQKVDAHDMGVLIANAWK